MDKELEDKIFESYKHDKEHNGWAHDYTPLHEVYETGYLEGMQSLEEENDELKSKMKKALEEINNAIWNMDNDLGRGAYHMATDAAKYLTIKE